MLADKNKSYHWLKQLGIAAAYLILGIIIHRYFTSNGSVSTLWPGSGLALAVLLIGGRGYIWGILLGALLLNVSANDSFLVGCGITLASGLEALLGHWLLTRDNRFISSLPTFPDYLRLILLGGLLACIVGATIGALVLLLSGFIVPEAYFITSLHWWMGDMLGIVLITPFILIRWHEKPSKFNLIQFVEIIFLISITFIAGQIIFLDWLDEYIIYAPRVYILFLFITWVSVRLGTRGTTGVLLMVAVQAVWGASQRLGFFANDMAMTNLHNYWLFMLVLSVVGMTLATYVDTIKQTLATLQLKDSALNAAANGIIITDSKGHIEWANPAYCKLTGFSQQEILGRNPGRIVNSGKQDNTFYQQLWGTILAKNVWHGDLINRRKDGSLYDEEMTITPLVNKFDEISHFVAVKQDITERKQTALALKNAHQRFQNMVDTTDGIVWETDAVSLDVTFISQQAERLLGYSVADWFKPNFWMAHLHPDDKDWVVEYGSICTAQLKTYDIEYRFIAKDGHIVWLRDIVTVVAENNKPRWLRGIMIDITEQKKVEVALRYSKARLALTVASAELGSWDWNIVTGDMIFNQRWAGMRGYQLEEIKPNINFRENAIHPEDIAKVKQVLTEHFEGHTSIFNFEYRVKTQSGSWIWILDRGTIIERDTEGKPLRMVGIEIDITARKSDEQDLRIAATAFEAQEGIMITDAANVILRVNRAFTVMTGYTAEDVIGKTPKTLNSNEQDENFYSAMWVKINTTGTWEGEILNRRKNGEIYPQHLTIATVKDIVGTVTNYVATLTDITTRKKAEQKITNLAFYDPLTQLPNRRFMLDRLGHALAASTRSHRDGALLFIDLDNFKTLNDTLGHDVGDELLQQVASRLLSCVREGDTVARLGGDEFVVILEELSKKDMKAAAQIDVIADEIITCLGQSYQLGSHKYSCTSSIGVALFNNHNDAIDELLKQADIAMYQAKKSGRNRLCFFDSKMQEVIVARVALENELREALQKQQLYLYYQIQVDSSSRPLGVEALIRWLHPERGIISPVEFIPLAEETELLLSIGQRVLEMACLQLEVWQQDEWTRDLTLSINVSAKQFHQAGFVMQVQTTLQHFNINPAQLKFELTESMLLEDIQTTIASMSALQEIGIQFSLDDFGTGYSSLQYLKQLPLNQLKIDQSFVRDIYFDSSDRSIVRTIIAMAKSLGLDVIAEGVETEDQQKILLEEGCSVFQGYLFGKLLPIDQIEVLLKEKHENKKKDL